MTPTTVLIFAKLPEPGRVNTRMVPPLTSDEAAALHACCLRCVCQRVSMQTSFQPILVGTPDDKLDELHRLVGPYVERVWPQRGGDLGLRLSTATERALRDGAAGVLLLGADSPTLPIAHLEQAAAGLATHDAVMVPSDDGGYVLLGVRSPATALFEQIDWGSDRVTEQTRRHAEKAGIDLVEPTTWYDLDHFDDLKRASKDLSEREAALLSTEHELHALLTALLERHDRGRSDQA